MTILKIDRSKPFDPTSVKVDTRYCIAGVSIAEEDGRSLVLTDVSLAAVSLKMVPEDSDIFLPAGEKLERMKAQGDICLDAKILQTLCENPTLIPDSWKEIAEDSARQFILFYGTILLNEHGMRCAPWLQFRYGRWYLGGYYPMDMQSNLRIYSAVLTTETDCIG